MKTLPPDSVSEPERLMFLYLDGLASAVEVQELNRLLKQDKTLMRQFALLLLQEVHLYELGQEGRLSVPVRPAAQPASLWASLAQRWSAGWGGPVLGHPAWTLGAAALLVGGLVFWRVASEWNLPRLSEIDGKIWVQQGTQRQVARARDRVRPGTLIVLEPGASATLQLGRESTFVRLTDQARLELPLRSTGKMMVLESGSITAEVAPQPPQHPLRIRTPQSESEVIGTTFKFTVSTNTTRLAVWSGSVRIHDPAGASATVASGQLAIVSAGLHLRTEALQGGVLREAWRDLSGSRISDLTNSSRFPDRPTERAVVDNLELASSLGDNYGLRLRGWVHVPRDGQYRFWIAGDDQAELWLSPSENSVQRSRICFTSEYTARREWDKHPEQRSGLVQLRSGREYYIEVLMKQSGGQDDLAVAWEGPGFSREVLSGRSLSPVIDDAVIGATLPKTP